MKTKFDSASKMIRLTPALMAVILTTGTTVHSGENTPTTKEPASPPEYVSTFITPTSLKEGRDPFHPKSTRFIAKPVVVKPAVGPVVLECKGVSGTADRPLAIINNRTFAVGEEQFVNTAAGRVKVKCLAIDGMKVRVQAQGEVRELLFSKGV